MKWFLIKVLLFVIIERTHITVGFSDRYMQVGIYSTIRRVYI
jgi:hypothetical protein